MRLTKTNTPWNYPLLQMSRISRINSFICRRFHDSPKRVGQHGGTERERRSFAGGHILLHDRFTTASENVPITARDDHDVFRMLIMLINKT